MEQKMTLEQSQIMLLNKVRLAFEILQKRMYDEAYGNSVDDFLIDDIKKESLKMLITNYLVALIGKNKEDRISLKNNYFNTLQKFRKEHKKDVRNLEFLRKKVYSHFDLDWVEYCDKISLDFIKETIIFIAQTLKEQEKEVMIRKEK